MFGHRPNTLARGIKRVLGDNAVGSLEPRLSFDFTQNRYSTVGGTKSLSSALTHVRNGNATMVDSDGLLKWAPHNLLTYSEDFSNAAWSKINGSLTLADAVLAPDGTMTADEFTSSASFGTLQQTLTLTNVKHKFSVWIKAGTSTSDWSLYDGSSGVTIATISPTSDWQLLTGEWTPSTASSICRLTDRDNSNTGSIYIWGAHLYRSDLGGMVDNPDRGDSYVPTTSSAVYLPRIGHHEYNGYEWVDKGLLAESEARTNLVTYSEDFNTSWSKVNVTLTPDDAVGPDGLESADLLVASTTNAQHRLNFTPTSSAGTQTFSVYMKAGGYSYAWLRIGLDGAWFDLTDGSSVSSSSGITPTTQDVGNGWYRYAITTTGASANDVLRINVSNASETSDFAGDGTSGIYIYGAQLEAGSVPSSYIPTSGSTVTRAAETFTVPSANLPWPTAEVIGPEQFDAAAATESSGVVQDGVNNDWTLTSAPANNSAIAYNAGFTANAGKVYRIQFEVYDYVSGSVASRIQGVNGATRSANGTYTEIVTALAVGDFIGVAVLSTSTLKVRNISVREINPLSVSIQLKGEMDYADEGGQVATYWSWLADASNRMSATLDTTSTFTGRPNFYLIESGVVDSVAGSATAYSPGLNVPFDIASRHGSTFINGAVDGVALTANTTPTALPDLSSTDLSLAYAFMGTISEFRVWNQDIQDSGLEEATEPSTEPTLSLTFDGQSSSFTDTGYLP